jgi:hypothetical protein
MLEIVHTSNKMQKNIRVAILTIKYNKAFKDQ